MIKKEIQKRVFIQSPVLTEDVDEIERILEKHNEDCKKLMREGRRDLIMLQSDLEKLQFRTV